MGNKREHDKRKCTKLTVHNKYYVLVTNILENYTKKYCRTEMGLSKRGSTK